MKCHIVVVNWNGHEDTEQCLVSIEKLQLANIVITVIDNSEDHEPLMTLESSFTDVHFVYNNANVGFAAACNQSMDYEWASDCDIVHFLNNDTVVLCDYVSSVLSLFLEFEQVVAVSPCINYFYDSDKSWFCNSSVNSCTGAVVHIQDKPNIPVYYVPWISGCAIFLRTSVFNNLGRFDESLYMYCEDVDFCLKSGLAGYKMAVVSIIGVLHKVSASATKVSTVSLYYDVRNKLIICRRYFSGQHGVRPFIHTFLREVKRVLFWHGWDVQKGTALGVVFRATAAAMVFPFKLNS